MYAEIYIQAKSNNQPLEDFSRRLFSRLGVAHFEERESSNYVEGHYFQACALGIEIVIAHSDTRGLENYRFCITLKAEDSIGHNTSYLQDHAHTLARLLSKHGWRCFVPDAANSVSGEHDGQIFEV